MKKPLINYAFIDSQNLHRGVRANGWDLDFVRFRIYLRDKYHVSKAFLFIGYVPSHELLYTRLQEAGYLVIFKPTLEQKGVRKGNCDADLVLHCMKQLPNFSKAVIVSGDGDFHCLIEELMNVNKLLKILTPNLRYSSLLRRFAAFITPIPFFRSKVEKHKKEEGHSRGT